MPHRSIRILIVEDDLLTQIALKETLERAGVRRVPASDTAEEALALAAAEACDMAFVDVSLAGEMDGIAVARRLRARYGLPVVFMTAYNDPDTRRRMAEFSPAAILEKPYRPPVVEALVRELAARPRPIDRPPQEVFDVLEQISFVADVGMCVTDASGRFVKVNETYCRMYGYAPEEMLGKSFLLVVPPEYHEMMDRLHEAYVLGESEESPGEWEVVRRNGEHYIVLATVARIYAADGRAFKVTTIRDMTEQKRREAELAGLVRSKDLLLRELHHRVRNNLNLISNILAMQMRESRTQQDVEAVLLDLMTRIQALVVIHDQLYRKEDAGAVDLGAYVGALVEQLHRTLVPAGENIMIELQLQPVETDMDTAISVGLIINELLTNSLKYAFAGRAEGRLGITLAYNGAECTLTISDDGPGLPGGLETGRAGSLGMMIVKSQAVQLGAELRYAYDEGARFDLRFPVRALVE